MDIRNLKLVPVRVPDPVKASRVDQPVDVFAMPLSKEEKRQRRQDEALQRAAADNAAGIKRRPSGRAPDGCEWNEQAGRWEDASGTARPQAQPHTSRSERRVQQRRASAEQSSKHAEYNAWHQELQRRLAYVPAAEQRFCGLGGPPPPGLAAPQGALLKTGSLRFAVGQDVWCCCGFAVCPGLGQGDNLAVDWIPSHPDRLRNPWRCGRIIQTWYHQASFGHDKCAAYLIALYEMQYGPHTCPTHGWHFELMQTRSYMIHAATQVYAPVDNDSCVRAAPPYPVLEDLHAAGTATTATPHGIPPSATPVRPSIPDEGYSALTSCSPRGFSGWDQDLLDGLDAFCRKHGVDRSDKESSDLGPDWIMCKRACGKPWKQCVWAQHMIECVREAA